MTVDAPIQVFHFTRVEHLAGVAAHGLVSDSVAIREGFTTVEIGDVGIKARRRVREVPCGPGGFVGDYAPFYFAPRSPMMYALKMGGYAYQGGFDRVIYLTSTLERLLELDCNCVITDRNAVLNIAAFGPPTKLAELVDQELMGRTYWHDTAEYPDRKECRMAECLVHGCAPWAAFDRIVCKTKATAGDVESLIDGLDHKPDVIVDANWYF